MSVVRSFAVAAAAALSFIRDSPSNAISGITASLGAASLLLSHFFSTTQIRIKEQWLGSCNYRQRTSLRLLIVHTGGLLTVHAHSDLRVGMGVPNRSDHSTTRLNDLISPTLIPE